MNWVNEMSKDMTNEIYEIKDTVIRNETHLHKICKQIDKIDTRLDYQRDYMHENRDKINWNTNKVHIAMGGIAALGLLATIMSII